MVVQVEVRLRHPVGPVSLRSEAWAYWGASLEALIPGEEQEGKHQEVACLHRNKMCLQFKQ